MSLHRIAMLGSLALLTALAAPAAHAAEAYDNCTGTIASLPAVLATQGTWCMTKDLSTALASGPAILIANNNITLDCNGFKLGGLAAGPATMAMGVNAISRRNVTIRNCNVRGFFTGVQLDSENVGSLIEGNRFEGNTFRSLWLFGEQNVVRDNLMFDTGGSMMSPDMPAYGILVDGGVDIVRNVIAGVAAKGAGQACGIIATGGPTVVRDNTIRDIVTVSPDAYATGISVEGTYGSIRGNDLFDTTTQESRGIHCGSETSIAVRDNIVSGFWDAMGTCASTLDNQTL